MIPFGIDICVIDGDAGERESLVKQLRGAEFDVVEAASGVEGLRKIYQSRPRIIICDVMLERLGGMQVCRAVRSDPTLDGAYFILVAAGDSATRRARAQRVGADDYVIRPIEFAQLMARIRSGMRMHRLQDRLTRAAVTDGLTGLWNHGEFRGALDREFQRTRRYGGTASLLLIDIDHFKAVNDTFGHEVGNEVLRLSARHLQRTIRETDIAARYGGEELVVICPETKIDEAVRLAERLRRTFPTHVRVPNSARFEVRASIGVASTEDARVRTVSDLVNLADQALYESKRGGRDRVTSAEAMRGGPPREEATVDEVDRLRKEVVALSMKTKELCLQSVWALIQALEARDGYSAWHSWNVSVYVRWLVESAGWSGAMVEAAVNAAKLHDLGKIGVPDELLLKPRPLDAAEAAVMRQVPLITCRILEPLRVFETEVQMIRHIRENFDGSGYPDGLMGAAIPIGSRVLAIVEAFDSLTCNRAYRQGKSVEEALQVLRGEAGRQFDPELIELLERDVAARADRWNHQIAKARVELPSALAGIVPSRAG